MGSKRTVPSIRSAKRRYGHDPLVMVTAYDAPSARVATEADVDMILVGDSLAMVVLGHHDTLQVTPDDIAYHVAAVCRSNPDALVVGDMPWMSFHLTAVETVRNAAKLVRAGAQCVKMEGGAKRIPMITPVLDSEIPVMAHIGLTPQSTNVMGGFKIQAREAAAVQALIADAVALEEAGCFAVVIEGVPGLAGRMVTEAISIPTIGIGAGPDTDGQVLVYHDLIGLENRFKPRFVRRYGTAFDDQVAAVARYAADVRSGAFPSAEESYQASDELSEALGLYGSQPVSKQDGSDDRQEGTS
ncbi:MAG: 3-methyl-2-oxobutanoate hydroxymethyltransferase [Acidimicrobiia bacterium]|nr:3-methyl-2-oxobutanoate hydroxymethyltransferase [Acidimicrobiia bacterium]